MIEAPRNIATKPIFGTKDGITTSVHMHNVDEALPTAKAGIKQGVREHYGPRGGALDYSRQNLGLVVTEPTPQAERHAAYVSDVLGRPFRMYSLSELQNGQHPADTLVVPYIHTPDAKGRVESLGQESWGLPPTMVEAMADKANFHRLVGTLGVEGLEVPDYKIARVSNFAETSKQVLSESAALYDQHSDALPGKYPLGLMIRPARSDGQFGSVKVVERADGEISVTIYGEDTVKETFPKGEWNAAIAMAKSGVVDNKEDKADPEIVVSRFVQLTDSPGQAFIVTDGQPVSLGWNAQLMEEGDTACKGTAVYEPKDEDARKMKGQFEAQSAEVYGETLRRTAARLGIPMTSINGTASFDAMLPGPLERALRKARGQGEGFYTAEVNARWTNWSDGVMAGVGITRKEPTIASMREVIQYGIQNHDKYQLDGADPEVFRDFVFEQDQKLATDGEARAFVRMPDAPAGVILLGDKGLAKQALNNAKEQAKRYAA